MPELNIKEREVQSSKGTPITILDCDGRITIGEGSVAMRHAVRRLVEAGRTNVILNLSGVRYVDSSGIHELVCSYTAITKQGGNLKLLHLTQKLNDLLTITKLSTVFDAYDNEHEALESYDRVVTDADIRRANPV